MTLLQINDAFKNATAAIAGLNGYSYGLPSDRVRSQVYDEPGEDQTDLYPRVLFEWPDSDLEIVPAVRNETYECVVYFDDLLGYTDDGEADTRTIAELHSNLKVLATRWVTKLQENKTDGRIVGNVRMRTNAFGGKQRLVTVILSFTFATKAVC